MTGDLFDPLAGPFRLDGSNGEAVVLQHGFTGTPALFRLMAPVLNQAGYTVQAPLLSGHGTSLEDMAAHGAEDWVRSARQGIEEVAGHRRIHLVGHSLGGLLGLALAREAGAATVTTITSPVRLRGRTAHLQARLAPIAARRRPVTLWDEGTPPDLGKTESRSAPRHGSPKSSGVRSPHTPPTAVRRHRSLPRRSPG